MRFILSFLFFLLACAHTPPVVDIRAPAADWGSAFTAAEEGICRNLECQSFMAPCDLLSMTSRQTSVLEDQYRDRVEAYKRIGYCLREPRPLPVPDYAKDTCFFLMVRGEVCK